MAQISCMENTDCPPANLCENGFCSPVISCNADEDCAAVGKVCHSTRGFCVQCDGKHENECPQGQTCQFDFTCVSIGGADAGTGPECQGACTTRDECMDTLVCNGGSCCPPPSRCTKNEDCPTSKPDCNVASGFCFGGDSCNSDVDCVGKPGCPGSTCECDLTTQPGICHPREDECQNDQDCFVMNTYDGKYCDLRQTPKLCLESRQCMDDIDCSFLYLVCDQRMGEASENRCINGMACPMGSECPPTQTCLDGSCVGQNCVNTPTLCAAMETCNTQTGRCESGGSTSCGVDTDCPQGQYCNTTSMACLAGCRDNSECPMGAICDASHRCVQSAGGLCGPCMDTADCPAGTICGLFSMLCVERCASGSCTLNPQAMCNMFGFCDC
jgi:hypothetical protein